MSDGFKKFLKFIGLIILMAVVGFVAALIYTHMDAGLHTIPDSLSSGSFLTETFKSTFILVFGVLFLLYVLYFFTKLEKSDLSGKSKSGTSAKTKEGKDIDQYFDSRWVTEKELKTEKKFLYCNWNTLRTQRDGMLIRSELVGKSNLNINMYGPIHAMIIGTTGTGKTERFIIPQIQVLSGTKTKPCFVVTDPKVSFMRKTADNF